MRYPGNATKMTNQTPDMNVQIAAEEPPSSCQWENYSVAGALEGDFFSPWILMQLQIITKTYLYNFDSLKPHFI